MSTTSAPAPHGKKALFIGNRVGVFRVLRELAGVRISSVLVEAGSLLDAHLQREGIPARRFTAADRAEVLAAIGASEFDLLVSNGCTFILPVSSLRRPDQLFLNVHPAYLPEGRGRHPVNGALLRGWGHIGATLHYMDDGVDTGGILHQEKIDITDDLDLALLYHLAFDLEARVFAEGMKRLAAADYRLPGTPHVGKGSYYSRKPADQIVDLRSSSNADLLRVIRAFGIKSQGTFCTTDQGTVRVFEAQEITNPCLLSRYAATPPGSIILRYGDKLLVRSRDGILKFFSYAEHHDTRA